MIKITRSSCLLVPCLSALLLGLVAVWPLLSRPMPATDDGMLHALRIMQLDRCLQHGTICLRWAPDMALGYGYPGFNFYLNLPTWIAEGYHLLGLSFVQALAAALATAVLLSGLGAFMLGRDLAGPWAGLIAATAYMYAPYQFFDTSYRGNLAETWALAWLPWLLWTARRATTGRQWRAIIPFALLYAAQLYTHNIYTMIGAPVLLGYLLLLWWTGERSPRLALRLGTMLALGLALGAFYWLPAFFEQSWVRYTPAMFDYTRHFLTVRELLAAPPAVDTALLNFFPPRSLSWGMLAVLLIGIAGYAGDKIRLKNENDTGQAPTRSDDANTNRRTKDKIGDVLRTCRIVLRQTQNEPTQGEWLPTFFFFLLVLFVYASLTLDLTQTLWDALPPLHMVQMPWRFLGPASLGGSLCAGMIFARSIARLRPARQTALIAAALTVMAIAVVPWTYAPPFPQPATLTVADMLRWELDTGLIGTTSVNEFLPRWASMPAEPADPTLLDEPSGMARRLDTDSLPPESRVLAADYRPLRAVLTLDLPQAARIVYKQFYFPDWQVRIDGRPATPVITAPYGLLGVDVPAGIHRIEIKPTTTPLRAIGTALTVAAGVGLILIAVGQRTISGQQPKIENQKSKIVNLQSAIVLILSLVLFILKITWIDRSDTPLRGRRFDGRRVPYARIQAGINFGNTMTLYGYTLPVQATPADRPLRVDLYVGAQRPLDTDWMAYARLVDRDGRLWSLRDNDTPDDLRALPPTWAWPTDMIGHWAYLAYPLPGTPPGEYWIEIALFERGTWRTLPVLDAQGQTIGLKTRIGPVQIGPARRQPLVENLDIAEPQDWEVDHTLRLLGSTSDHSEIWSGDTLRLSLFWQATARPRQNHTVALILADDAGPLTTTAPTSPGGDHPTVKWRTGEIVRSQHDLRIPPTTPDGTYHIYVVVADENGTEMQHELRSLTIHAPERRMSPPTGIAHRLEANLSDRVVMLGFDLPETTVSAGGTLSITLYWQARQEMDIAYQVFVQIVGPQGVLSQIDAAPVSNTRPTTGWVAGEVITDPYLLFLPADAPAGEYQLIAGLYDPNTLRRLPLLDAAGKVAGDHLTLAVVQVR